jgi:hypothetical protein
LFEAQEGTLVSITIELQPEVELGLIAQAKERGLSLVDFVHDIVVREAHVAPPSPVVRTGQDLIDACAKVRGLLTDEEIDTLFARNRSGARSVDLE